MTTELTTAESTEITVVPARVYDLKKVKLDKDGYVSAEYSLFENEVMSEFTVRRYQPAHEDMKAAFQRLAVHAALMTDQVGSVLHHDEEGEEKRVEFVGFGPLLDSGDLFNKVDFLDIRCSGFTIASGGVVLIAQRALRSGKSLNLITPFEVLEPEEPTGREYQYLDHLNDAVEAAIEETKLYLDGKHDWAGEQLDMFEPVATGRELGYTVSVGVAGGEMKDVTAAFERTAKNS